jgi:ribA/ribD-fused uncharacterized protein
LRPWSPAALWYDPGMTRTTTENRTWFTKRENGKTVHNWPSNFFIEPDGTNVEAEYQAAKHLAHEWRYATIMRSSPGRAKKLGRRWELTPEELEVWENNKLAVMMMLIRQKVADHPEIAMALIATGDENLVEQNWWHDNYWGNCTCLRCYHTGENHLGKIWMTVRGSISEAG